VVLTRRTVVVAFLALRLLQSILVGARGTRQALRRAASRLELSLKTRVTTLLAVLILVCTLRAVLASRFSGRALVLASSAGCALVAISRLGLVVADHAGLALSVGGARGTFGFVKASSAV
jgi:hypothetical protein